MTDKEKIRAEIEKKIKVLSPFIHQGSDTCGKVVRQLESLVSFIDSLPEEPVSIWHSIEELPTAREYEYILVIYKDTTAPCVAGNKTQVSYWDRVDKWAYLEDVLNLSNVKRTIKDWKELISEDLEKACEQLAEKARKHKAETSSPFFSPTDYKQGVIDGAKWQKENLWKPAEGSDLPIFDRDVIVLTQPYPLEGNEYVVSFAHRPNPDGWDGKSLTTGEVEHYTPKTYDKGGWNIPNIVYWLDVKLPKEIEL